MKRKRVLLVKLLYLLLGAILCGCGQSNTQYSVVFEENYEIEKENMVLEIPSGKKISEPEAPTREGYIFLGWFKNPGLTELWDFKKDKITSDVTLYAGWDMNTKDTIMFPENDKDFSKLRTPGSQEASYEYGTFFLPEADGINQPYVGDTMPYYEDGVFYIYYLKDGGDSYNHSVYLVTTTDFVHYTEQEEPVLEASRNGGQDGWIGTGSVVKIEETYYFFYTGHNGSATAEYKEKILVAKSDNLRSFEKIEEWEIAPPSELGQKNDFRDPQAYYDPVTETISLTITASQGNVARILKYTVDKNLQNTTYDGIIFSNKVGDFWNLECSDTFKIGDTWYITYSAQDDTLWYASSDQQFGPYSEAKRLEGKLFYAAKHVEDGKNSYMVGWARRSESVSSTQDVAAWAGNLLVHKIAQKENGELVLTPIDAVLEQFSVRRDLLLENPYTYVEAGSLYNYVEVFTCYESFVISGNFRYEGNGSFGMCFDYSGKEEKYKMISICPSENKLSLSFNEGNTLIAEKEIELTRGKEYSFKYIQDGSVGVFYIDDVAALTVRVYGVSGKPIRLFAENNSVMFSSLRQRTK